jgi:phosphatidate cytidylyltransferase
MLKKRLITAIILIPIMIALVLRLPPKGFGFFTTVVLMLGAYEWSSLMGIQSKILAWCYPIIIFALLPISLIIPIPYILIGAFLWWLVAFVLVVRYPAASDRWGKGLLWRGVMGICVFIPTWRALNFIRDADLHNGPYILLFLFVLIWGADSGAYFVGKKWGRTKLAPIVSPGKTLQGLYGALGVTMIIMLITLSFFLPPYQIWIAAIVVSMITVLFSVLGDLFESMLKRNVGLKDSGRFFPGHGGLLDRIDSLTAAAPIFALGSILMSKIFH